VRGAEVALGEVATVVRRTVDPDEIRDGTLYVGLENIEPGGDLEGVATVAAGDLASSKFIFDPADVLFGKLRPYLAKVARPSFAGICSTDILPIRPGSALDRDYLAHFLSHPNTVALAAQRATGANLPRLSPKELEKFRLPLPPLDEQRRIARVLDAADDVRVKRRQAIAGAARLPYSVLTHSAPALTSELVETCPLESLVPSGDRINYGVVQPGSQMEGGVPLIRAGDLVGGGVRRDGLKTIDPSVDAAYARSRIRGNEILLSCVGSVGVVARTTPEDVGFNIVRAVARIPIESQSLRAYVAAYLETPTAQRYFTAELRTVAQPTLNIKQIRALPIPRPTKGWLQRFAVRAKLIEQTSRRQLAHLSHLDALFVSLQSRAFAGEL